MAGDKARYIGIDVLRAVAILTVMALHWVNSGLAAPAISMGSDIFVRIAGHGTYGVTLFFILSGFLIMRTTMMREPDLFRLSPREFYIRRIARIQPLFLAVIALGIVTVWAGDSASRIFQYTFHEPKAVFTAEFWLSLFTFTFNWEMILHRNELSFRGLHWDVMWSLAVEEQFYLAFPFLLVWARTKARLCSVLWAIVAVGILVRVIDDILGAGLLVKLMNSFVCFDTLALGVLCAYLGERLPHGRIVSRAAVAVGTVAIATAFLRGGVVLLIIGACFFVHGARYADLFQSRAWIILARLGQLSYGLYLLHATALYGASPFLGGVGAVAGFVIVVGTAFLPAEIVYRAYEAPVNAWIRSAFLPKRPVDRRADGPSPSVVPVTNAE